MPQKSTRRFFAITSGTVLPLASANCCFDGLKGADDDFRERLLAIPFAFKVKAEGKSSHWIEPQRGAQMSVTEPRAVATGLESQLQKNRVHGPYGPVATARGSVTLCR